jgi:Domain of Unknown Function (DUF1080)
MPFLEFRYRKPACFWFAFTACSMMFAADKDFNGRWDIQVMNEPRARVWWLSVEGAGTHGIHGSFVGAPGGDVDAIPKIWIENGQLMWQFNKRYSPQANEGNYRARIENGKLAGSLTVAGYDAGNRTFEGVRAPEIKDVDDDSWTKGAPVELFNQRDLTGWHAMVPGKDLGWVMKDGALSNVAGANNLVSEQKFWNFELHAEFRLGKESNSGIGLRGRYEVQILEDYGKPADVHGMGALYGRATPSKNAGKGAGEWQTFDVRLVGRIVTITVNGEQVLTRFSIEGLTAIAHDRNEAEPGPISVQGDHGAVEIRKLTVTPLVKRRS